MESAVPHRIRSTARITDAQAEKAATVLIAAAALGALVYMARTPRLRRMAWRLAVAGVTSQLPGWIGREVQHAWSESGHSTP